MKDINRFLPEKEFLDKVLIDDRQILDDRGFIINAHIENDLKKVNIGVFKKTMIEFVDDREIKSHANASNEIQ